MFFSTFVQRHHIPLIMPATTIPKSLTNFTERLMATYLNQFHHPSIHGKFRIGPEVSRNIDAMLIFFWLVSWNQDLVLHEDVHHGFGIPDMGSNELCIYHAWQARSVTFSFGLMSCQGRRSRLFHTFLNVSGLKVSRYVVNLQIKFGTRCVQMSVSIANSGF